MLGYQYVIVLELVLESMDSSLSFSLFQTFIGPPVPAEYRIIDELYTHLNILTEELLSVKIKFLSEDDYFNFRRVLMK